MKQGGRSAITPRYLRNLRDHSPREEAGRKQGGSGDIIEGEPGGKQGGSSDTAPRMLEEPARVLGGDLGRKREEAARLLRWDLREGREEAVTLRRRMTSHVCQVQDVVRSM